MLNLNHKKKRRKKNSTKCATTPVFGKWYVRAHRAAFTFMITCNELCGLSFDLFEIRTSLWLTKKKKDRVRGPLVVTNVSFNRRNSNYLQTVRNYFRSRGMRERNKTKKIKPKYNSNKIPRPIHLEWVEVRCSHDFSRWVKMLLC